MWFLQSPHLTMWAFSQVCIILFLQVLNVWAVGNHCKAEAFIWVYLLGHASFLLCERGTASSSDELEGMATSLLSSTSPWAHSFLGGYKEMLQLTHPSLLSIRGWVLVSGLRCILTLQVFTIPLHPETRDSLLVFFLPVSITTTYLWKFMSHWMERMMRSKEGMVTLHWFTF